MWRLPLPLVTGTSTPYFRHGSCLESLDGPMFEKFSLRDVGGSERGKDGKDRGVLTVFRWMIGVVLSVAVSSCLQWFSHPIPSS